MGRWWLIGVIVGLMITGGPIAAEQETPQPDIPSGKGAKVEAVMDLTRLGKILKAAVPGAKGQDGFWQMAIEGVNVMVVADQEHNRMRVIAPAAKVDQVGPTVLRRMMEANFTSALDVRYGIFQGVIWAAFLHPLDSLTERELRSALDQVVTLVKTTGTTYSSSGLTFGGSRY
ncbi:MAG: hypothetical protein ACE5I9_08670 [Candidatus Methylomirabilales bacterium]